MSRSQYGNMMFPNGTDGAGYGDGSGNYNSSNLGGSQNGGSSFGSYLHNGQMGGAIGSLFSGLMGANAKNPADAGMPYEQDALNSLPGYYKPYMDAGQSQISPLEKQYSQLMNNPAGMMNQIGASYHQSPGFQFALHQAMNSANNASAGGGMAGSPMAQQQNMGTATQMGNQDYYNYMKNAMGMYGEGLQGAQDMYGMGANAANQLGTNMSNVYNNMAQMQYAGQQQQNQNKGSAAGGIGGALGTLGSMWASAGFPV